MKILFILTYYRPHVSGLTIYVERLAKALAERGHSVTVLTSHYTHDLPYEEQMDGVRVVRAPVAFRFNKGVVMLTFPAIAWREIRRHDVVSIHLPQVEAALSALLTRLAGRKPLITYHCDLQMPPVWYGKIVDRLTFWDNLIAGKLADTIVAYTRDFAEHSPFLSRFLGVTDSEIGEGKRHGDTETGRHGDTETGRHGDTETRGCLWMWVSPRHHVAPSPCPTARYA